MILILSFESFEQGTDPVIDWLLYHHANFIKITLKDILYGTQSYFLDVENESLFINDKKVNDSIQVIWFRRLINKSEILDLYSKKHSLKLAEDVLSEIETIIHFVAKIFSNKKWLPCFNGFYLNKLEELHLAKKAGLLVPQSIITNNKKNALHFNEKLGNGLITKAIGKKSYYNMNESVYVGLTKAFSDEMLNNLNDTFFPSLFQEKIIAEYEIRVFILDNEIYSTAIIYSDKKDEVDMKNYMSSPKNHYIPFNLPENIKQSLLHFMKKAQLNTGCADFIKTTDNNYYFIEINPVGQYLLPSNNCNYFIERKIAQWLIKNDIS